MPPHFLPNTYNTFLHTFPSCVLYVLLLLTTDVNSWWMAILPDCTPCGVPARLNGCDFGTILYGPAIIHTRRGALPCIVHYQPDCCCLDLVCRIAAKHAVLPPCPYLPSCGYCRILTPHCTDAAAVMVDAVAPIFYSVVQPFHLPANHNYRVVADRFLTAVSLPPSPPTAALPPPSLPALHTAA